MADYDDLPEGPQVVPGQVIIKLTQTAQRQMTAAVPTGPMRGMTADAPCELGVDTIDKVLKKCKARTINRLHGPIPTSTLSNAATAEVAGDLVGTMRVRYDSGDDPEQVAKDLKKAAGVTDASAEYYRFSSATPNDPDFGQLWGMQAINAPAAWDRTTGCSNVVVGVLDTGVDLNHPDLAPNLVQGRDMVDLPGATPPPGFHFEGDNVGRDSIPQDEVGHGTHVAGTIGAVGNNGTGVVGVCWSVKLMPVKVLTRIVNNTDPLDVRGTGSSADVAAGIRWAVDNGAHILNLSLGSLSSTFVERDAVAYAVSRGVLVVAAMGNHEQRNPGAPSYPAAYPNVLSVGAVNQAKQRAPFSVRGPHIDVVAPGVGIRSTDWDDTYSSKSGTSMATPHVAGLAALMKCCKSSLTADQIADIIRQTAEPLRDNPGDPVPNDSYGAGLIDAQKAINRACPRFTLPPCRPCIIPPPPCRPCIIPPPPPPCRPCLPPPPCRPCLPPPPCVACLPPPPPPPPCIACPPCGPCIRRGSAEEAASGSAQASAAGSGDAASPTFTPPPCPPCVGPCQPCLPPPPPPCQPCLPPPPPCRPCLPPPPCFPCRPCLPPPPPPPPPCFPCRPCVPPPPPPCFFASPGQSSETGAYGDPSAGYGDAGWAGDWSGYDWSGYDWSGYGDGSGYDWSAYGYADPYAGWYDDGEGGSQ
ncbi:S8 family peptidase [Roseobacter sinensis]|uniref:S8 family peptidase n=1 Tax=Roseobacter sinensis TaxID=2931391 RepID=A0ABT3BGV1_9RHOB|nr:S8 family peptidase [Roseobacter sp. WL0113]MCV3272809.1 S8 family peptidase [Roseobacter sp. WL0113]